MPVAAVWKITSSLIPAPANGYSRVAGVRSCEAEGWVEGSMDPSLPVAVASQTSVSQKNLQATPTSITAY